MTINLLPQKEKKRVQKLYKAQRIKASSWLVIILIIVSVIMLAPLFLLSENIEFITEIKNTELVKESGFNSSENIEEAIGMINSKALALSETQHIKVYDLFADIAEGDLKGISIRGLTFSFIEEEKVIGITGTAINRETLLSFRRDLEQKPYSESVNLPVSNFAQNTDINFSIQVVIAEENNVN